MKPSVQNRVQSLALTAAFSCTLLVSPWSNWDPINLIKVLSIASFGFAIAFIIFQSLIQNKFEGIQLSDILFMAFICFLIPPIIFSGAPLTQQFWGVMGRNTGALTYLSLAFIAWGVSRTNLIYLEKKAINVLLITGLFSIMYGYLQYFKRDPIGWSSKFVFGTLGNVNFFAAFLALVNIAVIALTFGPDGKSSGKRIGLGIFALLISFLNLKTDSMQGPVTTLVGLVVITLLILKIKGFFTRALNTFITFAFLISASVFGFFGLLGRGPLGTYLYQDSNVFRKDYMLAGIKMTLNHPLFGVGLDSYDNWYRAERGLVAAFRTGLNRTSNSAHNIFLDISSGGGFPLLISYVSLVGYVLWKCFSLIKNSSKLSDGFIGVFSCWVAYIFQSLLSINQVGVGVWGWLLLGILISVVKRENADLVFDPTSKKTSAKKAKKLTASPVPASTAILGLLGFFSGFILAYLPLSADASFRKAMDSRDVPGMSNALNKPGASAYFVSKALDSAINSRNNELAKELAEKLTNSYPREIFGWDVKARSSLFTPDIRTAAIEKIQNIDPNIFCFSSDPQRAFLDEFDKLGLSSKGELLAWWGLLPRSGASQIEISEARNNPAFFDRVKALCQ